jgi:hypothetical protein
MTLEVRRIVTGHNEFGMGIVVSDEKLSAVSRGLGANISGCEIDRRARDGRCDQHLAYPRGCEPDRWGRGHGNPLHAATATHDIREAAESSSRPKQREALFGRIDRRRNRFAMARRRNTFATKEV